MDPKSKELEKALNPFASLVVDLREKLKLTQKSLADAIGVTVTTVARWEMKSNDSLQSLPIIRILALFADDSVRQKFALRYENARRGAMPSNNGTLSESEQALLRNHSDAATGINILFEMAQAGNPGAAEALRDLAQNINRKAGDWRRMKYLKK